MDNTKNQHKHVNSVDSFKDLIGVDQKTTDRIPKNDVFFLEKEDSKNAKSSDSDTWIDSSSSSADDSDTMDLEWFADDGPIDAKPIASIEPKYDFEVNPIIESKYDFEVKLIRLLEPKYDFEVKTISLVGPKCDFEAEPIELVRPKCDFEAKPVKSLDLKCDFARENEENKLVRTSNVFKTYKGAGLLNLAKTYFLNAFVVLNVVKISDFTSGFHKNEQEDAHKFFQCFHNRLESRCSDIVQQVFCVHFVSKLSCCNCGYYSNTYDPLIDVSLEINDVDNLHSALESFTRVKKLVDPEIKFSYGICEVEKHVSFLMELDLLLYTDNNQTNNEQIKYDLYAVIVHAGSTSSSGHYYCFICAEPNEWYKFDDSMFSDFVALQMHNVDTIPKLSFLLPNHHASDVSESIATAVDTSSSAPRPTDAINSSYFHELMKIVDNELKKTVQTSTPGQPSAINSSKENNASQDVGVIERMAPLLPKSPSRSQSTLGRSGF
ncbi:hypothetical protein FXO38_03838 [Capsicum annuum]|nr:hypothetical protein FXO38_03838 [Capsicum annuum]